jgi:hypothetical protein
MFLTWVVQRSRLALSKGPNRVGVSPHLRTETDAVSETSYFSSAYLESGQWTKPEHPVILCENSWPYRDLNSDTSVIQPVANRYTNCAILAHIQIEVAGLNPGTFRIGIRHYQWLASLHTPKYVYNPMSVNYRTLFPLQGLNIKSLTQLAV